MFDAKKVLIPYPQEISDTKGDVKIASLLKADFLVEKCSGGVVFDEAIELLYSHLKKNYAIKEDNASSFFKISITKNADNPSVRGRAEAYTLNIDEKAACLCATDDAGVYYGILTLCALMHTEGNDIYLPMVDIVDYPRFKDRGQFLECRYGSDFMTKEDYKNAIDYCEYKILNHNKYIIIPAYKYNGSFSNKEELVFYLNTTTGTLKEL